MSAVTLICKRAEIKPTIGGDLSIEVYMTEGQMDNGIEALGGADVAQLRADAMTMAFRLYGADPATFSPEVREVMSRWTPLIEAAMDGSGT